MDRLTIPDKPIEGGTRRAVIDAREVKKHTMTIYWQLKKYEDTGLMPEEIMDGKLLTGWIPVEERLPVTDDGYAHIMVSMDDGFVCTTDYTDRDGFELWADSGEVIAWMPLPEPYKPQNLAYADNDTEKPGLQSAT